MKQGISLIEILLVISIIAILGASVTPFISSFVLRNNNDAAVDRTIGTIRKAQEYSINRKNGQEWGVCLTNNYLRLFRGSCTNPQFNEDFAIPNAINITGLNETIFNKYGQPSIAMNIIINSDIETTNITVNSIGGMEIN